MQEQVATETWALLLIRLCYIGVECANQIDWMARFAEARICSTKFSLVLYMLFRGLSVQNKRKQQGYLKECSWASFPAPLQEWLTARYGESIQSSFSDSSKSPDLESWTNFT